MVAVEHIQYGGSNVGHEFALHGTAVVIFRAGAYVPEADILPRRPYAAPPPYPLGAEVGAVFVLIFVEALVNAAGPERTLLRRARDRDGRATGTSMSLYGLNRRSSS